MLAILVKNRISDRKYDWSISVGQSKLVKITDYRQERYVQIFLKKTSKLLFLKTTFLKETIKVFWNPWTTCFDILHKISSNLTSFSVLSFELTHLIDDRCHTERDAHQQHAGEQQEASRDDDGPACSLW